MTLPRPITLARRADWRGAEGLQRGRIPAQLRPWVLAEDSLTARVRALCPGRFRLEVLRQSRACPRPDEARALRVDVCKPALLREVALCCGDTPLIMARTVIPASSLHGRCRRLAGLGRQPLGAVLFADRSTRRGPFAVTRLSFSRAGLAGQPGTGGSIWGRRAVFHFSGAPLLVSEFFLPSLWNSASD